MPKRRELLIILILAVLVTGLGGFYCREVNMPHVLALIPTRVCGFPLGWSIIAWRAGRWIDFISEFSISNFLNLLFWFVVLAAGWWVVRRIRRI